MVSGSLLRSPTKFLLYTLLMTQRIKIISFITLFSVFGLLLRFWHNDFGLPHSFYADEPELAELAIKYTFELRSILSNNEWYKLIPISYVYGTFPTYVLTLFTIIFSKTLGLLGITFSKMDIYVYLRTLTGIFSFLIVPTIYYLYLKLFKDMFGALFSFFLLAFNWRLIVHSHYVNADIFITILLSLSFLTMYLYKTGKKDTLYTILSGILFGLAVGTKITVLLTLPLYWYLFIKKKDIRGLVAFSFIIFGAFMLSNPFSIIYANDFVFRIYTMLFKEAGLVFDSVDLNPFKYVIALSWISTLPVLLLSVFGIYKTYRGGKDKSFHIFLLGNVILYLIFYSLQSRRVDRWLLPILPLIILYASFGISSIKKKLNFFGNLLVFGYYLYFPILLLTQFQQNTPKSSAYLWMRENTIIDDPTIKTLVYTEEGLDPMNKLPYSKVYQYNVYEGDGAHLFLPDDPYLYNYVILSSRPMENYKRVPVGDKYPEYHKAWESFENEVTNNFELIQSFELSKPNLIPLSDVYIYENLTINNP